MKKLFLAFLLFLATPCWATTVLDLQFTGADGTTTFTDSSPSAHTINRGANAQITSNKLALDGTGYASTNDSPDFSFSNQDFDITFKIRATSLQTNNVVFEEYNYSGGSGNGNDLISFLHNSTNGWKFILKAGGSTLVSLSETSSPIALNTDYLMEIKRAGNSITIKENGNTILSTSFSGNMPDPNNIFYIGYSFYALNQSLRWNGSIDDFKIDTGFVGGSSDAPVWTEACSSHVNTGHPRQYEGPIYFSTCDNTGSGCTQAGPNIGTFGVIDLTQAPWNLPADTIAVDLRGMAIVSHGSATATTKTGLIFRAYGDTTTDCTEDNYMGQTVVTNAAQGIRSSLSSIVPVVDGKIEACMLACDDVSGTCTDLTPAGYPTHSTAAYNLSVQQYWQGCP